MGAEYGGCGARRAGRRAAGGVATAAAAAVSAMIRARSVAGPLRRAHPASGATWNVQVVRGKMSSRCLWHACRALAAGLLLMLLGAAMAVIGYYADSLSVAQEVRGNATVAVKDEARGFHLNNLSYAGPIVMGFGGFIVVAACVMTFEARDSAAKVTPARPAGAALPRPARRAPGAAPADALGLYRLPLVLPRAVPPPRRAHHRAREEGGARSAGGASGVRGSSGARYGSAPDLRSSSRAPPAAAALRRPLRRYALSVDEPPHSTLSSASAAESEAGSQCSLALEVHAGAAAGATLRVRDVARAGARDAARDAARRRRPLARQPRLRDDPPATPRDSCSHIHNLLEETTRTKNGAESNKESVEMVQGRVASPQPSSPAPPPDSPPPAPPPSTPPVPSTPPAAMTPPPPTPASSPDTCIVIEQPETAEHEPPDP